MKSRFATLVLALAALTASAFSQVVPAKDLVYGKSLTEWMNDYFVWSNTAADTTVPYQPGSDPLVFMPIPNGEIHITLKKGTSFVLPMFGWVIEKYADGSEDPFLGKEFWQSIISCPGDATRPPEILLDGQPILRNFWSYWCNGTYFPQPLPYDPWHDYGDGVLATHAIGVEGVGFICGPLTPGVHTLTLSEELSAFGVVFTNTWIIKVTK